MVRLAATESGVRQAASLVRSGGVILWPSGGVYGLAASALFPEAIDRIYAAKGRPEGKPLQVLASPANAGQLAVVPAPVLRLIDRLWPGFVGFVVRRKAPELACVAAPDDTVLLVCSNWVANLLSLETGGPVVATSANLSGRPEVLAPGEAARSFAGSVDAIIDGGDQTGELNTLIDVSRQPYRVLRRGAVEADTLLAKLAETSQD